jgi:hypothetical protein
MAPGVMGPDPILAAGRLRLAVGATETKLNLIAPGIHEIRLSIPWEEEIVNCFLFSDGAQVDLLDCGIQTDASVATVMAAIH